MEKQNIQAKEVYSSTGFSENDCHSGGSKLSNVTSFIILRYEWGLTSFNRNNRANDFGEKSNMKLPGLFIVWNTRKKLMSNLVFVVALVLKSKAL